jgi:hypothetical protein
LQGGNLCKDIDKEGCVERERAEDRYVLFRWQEMVQCLPQSGGANDGGSLVAVQFQVPGDGGYTIATVTRSTGPYSAARHCLLNAVSAWRFEGVTAGTYEYELKFEP